MLLNSVRLLGSPLGGAENNITSHSHAVWKVKMNIKRTIAALALTGALSGVAGAAVADTQYPADGGQWNYGFTGVDIYSDYLAYRCHGSSVMNDWGYNSSINVASGYWSNARLGATPWTHNSYYYRVC